MPGHQSDGPNTREVHIVAHAIDALPAHVTITGRGRASTLRVAAGRAVEAIIASPELKRKRWNEFKMSLVVIK